MKENFKKIICLIALFACVIGAIGGFGYLVWLKEYVAAVCLIVVAACAVPTVIKMAKFLKS